MVLCFKKGADSIFDWAIRLRTASKYVHSELLFSDGTTWRVSPGAQPASRYEINQQYPISDWDLVTVSNNPIEESAVRKFADSQIGKSYDWVGILNFVFPYGEDDDEDLFCSEGCTLALQQIGLLCDVNAKTVSPGRLYQLMKITALFRFGWEKNL